jgi:hypothetical protein
MAIDLGKDSAAPPFGLDIISATFTEECEAVDVSNRSNISGATGGAGYRAFDAGFKTQTWEIECHDVTGVVASLESNSLTSNFMIVSVTENAAIDGPVTYTITARRG